MPRYRVTLGFIKYTYGPTETYISKDLTLNTVTPAVQALITARNKMHFQDTLWAGVRISTEGAKQRSVFYPPGDYEPFVTGQLLTVPPRGLIVPNIETTRADQAKSCLQIRLTYDVDRRCIRYLALPPDSVLMDEPESVNLDANGAYSTAFGEFRALLIGSAWAIKGRMRTALFAEIPIENWVQSATSPTDVGVVIPSLPAPGIKVRDFISIKGVRRKGLDRLSYNGRYIVSALNTTLLPDKTIVYLRGTEIGDPASVKLLGTIQRIGHDYFPILNMEGLRAGTHKRGKPLGSPRGKSQKRPTLDP